MNGNGNGNMNASNGIRNRQQQQAINNNKKKKDLQTIMSMSKKPPNSTSLLLAEACYRSWSMKDFWGLPKNHPIPFIFGVLVFFFMGVEYTLLMIPHSSPPFDLGFILTRPIHRFLVAEPFLNSLLAGLNTVFVAMQATYILWAWLVEGRARSTIATVFMFTSRGILGYSTQLPLPQEFLGSGADFPVGNVSFFLFYSGHVAGSVIASLDMRRMQRCGTASLFDALNVLQMVRLLGTRGHYTIDLAVGLGAGFLFDSLAGKYQDNKKKRGEQPTHLV